MGQVGLVPRGPVPGDGLDVAVLVAHLWCLDFQNTAVSKMQFQIGHVRRPDHILPAARAYGVEAHCAENVPCRHLSAVVVAA